MPSGPPELHEKWQDDGRAYYALNTTGWKVNRGGYMLYPPGRTREYAEESSALDYLVQEWDYGVSPRLVLLLTFAGTPAVR